MYDPECKYCPRCRAEYIPTVDRCADCDVDLVTGQQMIELAETVQRARESRAGVIGPDDEVVTVFRGQVHEIRAFEELLAEERIATVVTGDGQSCGKGCCPTTLYLNVRADDAMDALRIIQQEIDRTTAIHGHDLSHADAVFNPDAPEVTCPACGARFQPNSTECPDCGLCF